MMCEQCMTEHGYDQSPCLYDCGCHDAMEETSMDPSDDLTENDDINAGAWIPSHATAKQAQLSEEHYDVL